MHVELCFSMFTNQILISIKMKWLEYYWLIECLFIYSGSNNYVFLQSMRNGNMGFDMNGHSSLMRNPLYLSYSVNNPNPNLIYANDDSINIRSTHLEDQMGSEHSYNSNKSRNLGFEILPPILPNFGTFPWIHF